MLTFSFSALALPRGEDLRQLTPTGKTTSTLSSLEASAYEYWEARARHIGLPPSSLPLPRPYSHASSRAAQTKSAEKSLPSIPLIPKDVKLSRLAAYDPTLYPGTACESFCSSDVSIDVGAATAAGRATFPSDGLADWNEKCSWDKYCAGCSECDDASVVAGGYVNKHGPLGQCASMCEVISDSDEAPMWKKETRNWGELCNWGPCYGCPSCLPANAANPPPPPCDASMYEYVEQRKTAIEGFKIDKIYYDPRNGVTETSPDGRAKTVYDLCPCKVACGEDDNCMAFVDVSYQDPPYCITKSNITTIHEASDISDSGDDIVKDTYIKKDIAEAAGIVDESAGGKGGGGKGGQEGKGGKGDAPSNNFMGDD